MLLSSVKTRKTSGKAWQYHVEISHFHSLSLLERVTSKLIVMIERQGHYFSIFWSAVNK